MQNYLEARLVLFDENTFPISVRQPDRLSTHCGAMYALTQQVANHEKQTVIREQCRLSERSCDLPNEAKNVSDIS